MSPSESMVPGGPSVPQLVVAAPAPEPEPEPAVSLSSPDDCCTICLFSHIAASRLSFSGGPGGGRGPFLLTLTTRKVMLMTSKGVPYSCVCVCADGRIHLASLCL